MGMLWWQSKHETSSPPGSAIRSARVGEMAIGRYSTDGAITVVAPGLPEASPGRPQPGCYWAGRPNCAELYGKEPDFRPIFSLSLRTSMDWPSEAEFSSN